MAVNDNFLLGSLDMFWTAMVWGLGVSCGASIGMMGFVVMMELFNRLTKTEIAKRAIEVHELSIAALRKRNDIGEESNALLERVAAAMEAMYAKES